MSIVNAYRQGFMSAFMGYNNPYRFGIDRAFWDKGLMDGESSGVFQRPVYAKQLKNDKLVKNCDFAIKVKELSSDIFDSNGDIRNFNISYSAMNLAPSPYKTNPSQ